MKTTGVEDNGGSVRIQDQKVWVGEQPIALMGGEVHYWRLAPESWRAVLEKVQALGIEVVATYVCWDFHELEPGKYDFQGYTDPRRNLHGFLDLLEEMGFWVIIRPGPYIYSEWSNAGVPTYAARYHRLDPAYLPLARVWLEAVTQVILPRQATRGGRIILCQAENELDCWPHMYTEPLGLGKQPGMFQDFLKERYEEIERLNQVWGSTHNSFTEARAVLTLPPSHRDWLPRYLDFYRFKHWYVARGIRWAADTLRELGIEVPLLTNTIAVHANEPWAEMERIAGLNGVDLYPSRDFHHPDEHRKYLEAVRYLRVYSRLPYVAEFAAGVWHGAHVESQVGAPGPDHYRLAAVSALMGGVVGWNWYMLANRDNWSMAPINENGRIRTDLYAAFSQVAALYHELDPASLEKMVSIAATIDPLHQAAEHAESEVLAALYIAGLDYDFYDLSLGQPDRAAALPLLLYTGEGWLSELGQSRLLEYITAGGHLLCLGNTPRFNDLLLPLNRLEIPQPAGAVGDMGLISLVLEAAGERIPIRSRWFEIFSTVPGTPLVAMRGSVDEEAGEEMQYLCNLPAGERYTVGFTRSIGRGSLTYLGLQPGPALLLGLCKAFGIQLPVQSASPGVSAALFHRKGQAGRMYLMAAGVDGEDRAAEFCFQTGLFSSPPAFRDLFSGETIAASATERAFLPLRHKGAAVWEIMEGQGQ